MNWKENDREKDFQAVVCRKLNSCPLIFVEYCNYRSESLVRGCSCDHASLSIAVMLSIRT